MDQSLDGLARSLTVSASRVVLPGQTTADRSVSSGPSVQNVRRGAGSTLRSLAGIGSRLALAARRIGQPADTFSGLDAATPEDIRTRYVLGLYGVVDAPPSLRDPNRRW